MRPKLSWIHLSDWHQNGSGVFRDKVKNALLLDIKNRTAIDPSLQNIDFIVFSGDIAFKGKPNDYSNVEKDLFEPILKAANLEGRFDRLFIVPGNHDLDRDNLGFLDQDLYKKPQSVLEEAYRNENTRKILLFPMTSYNDFSKKLITDGSQPVDGYCKVFTSTCGKSVGIFGLNTAWLSGLHLGKDMEGKSTVDDKGWLAIVESQFSEYFSANPDVNIWICLQHHPFDWINQNNYSFDSSVIENQIIEKCHFILHGHNHKSRAKLIVDHVSDCVTISAGSLFINSERTEKPANGYNLVQLDFLNGQGKVYIRRYEDQKSKWIQDEINTGSKTPGYWNFQLPKGLGSDAKTTDCSLLLVDNSESQLLTKARVLQEIGKFRSVFKAKSKEEVAKVIEEESIDLAIIDVRMGDEKYGDYSGLEIKDMVAKQGVPVVLMTAYNDVRDYQMVVNSPFQVKDYILKSVENDEFIKRINGALRLSL